MKRIAQYLGLTALTFALTGCSPSSDKPAADGSSNASSNTSAPSKTVEVFNEAGITNSQAVDVPVLTPLTVTENPQGQSVVAGTLVVLDVAANGSSPVSYQWYHDRAAVDGATESSLQISNVSAANQGTYHVVLSNPVNTVTSGSATVVVNPKGIIAYTPLTLSNPFFKVIGDHITAEAAKNGYDTLMVDPDMDVKKQSDQFDDFISSDVTAIILVPCDRLSIGPAVKSANAKGIPVFTVDAKCAAEGAEIAGHVGTDNFQGGVLAGQAMIKALGENGGKVLILDFKKANSCVLRVAGFKKVINAHNSGRTTGKIEIVAELNGNGARTEGYQSTADALQAHDDLDAVFAINDPSALGAYTAIEEAKKQDQIKIIGFDGQLDGKQGIKDGKIFADPIQHPDKMGQQIVQNIIKYLAGEEYEKDALIPATLYDKAAADQDPELN